MPEPSRTSTASIEVRRVRHSTRSVVLIVASTFAVFLLRNAFVEAQRVLGWALASAIAAILVEPIVNVLGRWIPRVAAVLLTLAVAGGAVMGLVVGSIDDLDSEIARLERSAPAATERLEAREDEVGGVLRDIELSTRVEVFLQELDDRVGSGTGALTQTAPTAPAYAVSAILTIFLLLYGPAMIVGAAEQITDRAHRSLVLAVLYEAVGAARRTVFAFLAQGMLVGALVWTAATVLDLPAPIVLGLVAGVAGMLPDVGILLGVLPTVALASGLETGRVGVALLACAFALQSFEALYVRQRVDRWGVAVGPAVVWVVALLGYQIHGIGAAAYGVILAIFAVALIDRVPDLRNAISADIDEP